MKKLREFEGWFPIEEKNPTFANRWQKGRYAPRKSAQMGEPVFYWHYWYPRSRRFCKTPIYRPLSSFVRKKYKRFINEESE